MSSLAFILVACISLVAGYYMGWSRGWKRGFYEALGIHRKVFGANK